MATVAGVQHELMANGGGGIHEYLCSLGTYHTTPSDAAALMRHPEHHPAQARPPRRHPWPTFDPCSLPSHNVRLKTTKWTTRSAQLVALDRWDQSCEGRVILPLVSSGTETCYHPGCGCRLFLARAETCKSTYLIGATDVGRHICVPLLFDGVEHESFMYGTLPSAPAMYLRLPANSGKCCDVFIFRSLH